MAKEEVGDGLKELKCHGERKHAGKLWMDGGRRAETAEEAGTCATD